MPVHDWLRLTSRDFARDRHADSIAVLPVAATEQHGPHLPLGTDVFIGRACLEAARPLVGPDLQAIVLPELTVGLSPEHQDFPGTLTLGAQTLLGVLLDIGAGVHRAGLRKLVIVSSHGGNSGVIEIAARELRLRHGMLVVFTSWARLGYPESLFSDAEVEFGIHAGEIETSLMLASNPELVRMEQAKDWVPRGATMPDEFRVLRLGRPAGFGWLAQDLHPSGAAGKAAGAIGAKGAAAIAHAARAFAHLLADVQRFELNA